MKAFALLLFFILPIVLLRLSIHKVDEGHYGVYYRGGALLDRVSKPGYHFKYPLIDQAENVQITVQTDKVTDIPCGTSGGVLIWFDRVEVVNRLKPEYVYETIKNYTVHYDKMWIFDKIHHEYTDNQNLTVKFLGGNLTVKKINQFCSSHTLQEVYIDLFHTVDERLAQALQTDCDKWAPGIEIIAIRITKPKIPQTISRNYEQMEAEKTKLLIATQAQKVIEKEAETDRKKARIEAEKVAEVSKIRMDQQINEKEALKKMAEIEDSTHISHEKALADAEYYKVVKSAEAMQKQLTNEFLMHEWVKAISNNTKIYFGPSVNSMLLDFMQDYQEKLKPYTKPNQN